MNNNDNNVCYIADINNDYIDEFIFKLLNFMDSLEITNDFTKLMLYYSKLDITPKSLLIFVINRYDNLYNSHFSFSKFRHNDEFYNKILKYVIDKLIYHCPSKLENEDLFDLYDYVIIGLEDKDYYIEHIKNICNI